MSAGRGPQECCWAVAELAKRLEADAAHQKVTARRVETVAGERAGTLRSVLFEIDSPSFARSWTGTLCWQGASPYRIGHNRKNWYVIAQPVTAGTAAPDFDEADIDFVPVRTGGPGGQHRNKASTAVRATHRPSGLVVVVDTERQLSLNRRLAIDLLRRRLAGRAADATRATIAARRHVHDELIRGNPIRTFTS